MKLSGLEVQFTGFSHEPPTPEALPDKDISEIQEKIADYSLKVDEAALKQSQLEEMWITDPYKAEQLLFHESLEDDNQDDEAV